MSNAWLVTGLECVLTIRIRSCDSLDSHALRSSASHAIVQVDYSGAETSRLEEFEIPT